VLRALRETTELDKAIKKGDEMTWDNDTLIVVTADHAHVMYFAGIKIS
jgi:alkaline phosphatase